MTKFLIYGGQGWIGTQFIQLLEGKGINFVLSEKRPGEDSEEILLGEILHTHPTHVVSFLGRTHGPGQPNIDYLEGGPDKLFINLRDNLYAPYTLANLCKKRSVHFTYLGTGCLFEYNEKQRIGESGYKEDDIALFKGNSYSVVKGFTDRIMHNFENVLNVRIRYPFNTEDSGRNLLRKLISFKKIIDIPNSITYLPNCLPILLDLCLKRHTGTINLVNPGTITFPRILEIYQEVTGNSLEYIVESVEPMQAFPKQSKIPENQNINPNAPVFNTEASAVFPLSLHTTPILISYILTVEQDQKRFIKKLQNNPNSIKNRAHCTLDTKKLEELYPNVLNIESAVREASEKLKII